MLFFFVVKFIYSNRNYKLIFQEKGYMMKREKRSRKQIKTIWWFVIIAWRQKWMGMRRRYFTAFHTGTADKEKCTAEKE